MTDKTLKHPTVKELQLAGRLLSLAENQFSNHGCNDMDEDTWGDFTTEERQALIREYYIWNGEPEEAEENRDDIEDWVLMSFLAEKLKAFSA